MRGFGSVERCGPPHPPRNAPRCAATSPLRGEVEYATRHCLHNSSPDQVAERTDGDHHNNAGRTGRPLAAAARSARKGHRPRRIHPHHAASPACCMAKSFAAQSRTAASSRSMSSEARKVPGVYQVVTSEDVIKVIPDPYYGPAFHDQPILAIGKVHYVGEPVAVVLANDPHVAEEAAAADRRRIRRTAAGVDEVEAFDNKVLVHDELKPAGTFADLKHLKGRKGTNVALDYRLRRGDVDKAFARSRARVRAYLPYPEGPASRARTLRVDRRLEADRASPSTAARRDPPSCARRSPGCSAGRKTRCVSRCRISAAASAASSTSSSKRWRWRCR